MDEENNKNILDFANAMEMSKDPVTTKLRREINNLKREVRELKQRVRHLETEKQKIKY